VSESSNPSAPLLGRYQPISDIARSPIGGLVMALDIPERHIVALRSLPVESKVSPDVSAQLLEAGRWVRGLDDPAVMTPLEVGTQEGLLHASFSYSVAEPLRGVLRLVSFRGSPIPVGVALRIAHDIVLGARAIEACGASPALGASLCGGLIPDSILVGLDGKTRLCDAGIATILRRTTEYGQHPDLLSYAAPEQIDGASGIDGRSDVFSIGICLWEMLANRRLFSAPQAQAVADRVRTLPVASLDTLQRGAAGPMPASVVAVVKRALERTAADRYQGTTALLQALETQCGELMATPQDVQHYMNGLLGNIFETRNRAMERAVPGIGISNRPAAPAADSAAQGEKAHNSDSLAPDTVRDLPPPPKLPSLPPPPIPSPASTSRPPIAPVIPTMPKPFELPGAALFATPGVPAVKPALPKTATVAATHSLPKGAADEAKVNPVGPTIPAPAATPEPPPTSEPARPQQPRLKSRIAWVSILSLVGCAFIVGISLRRCATQPSDNQGLPRIEATQDAGLQDASTAPVSISGDTTNAADASVADAAVSDGGAAVLIRDAGAAAAAAKPKPARPYVRRTTPHAAAARSSSKVVKGKGKIVRSR
jgi:eukaryotic-like serine/threonine-protein kinase